MHVRDDICPMKCSVYDTKTAAKHSAFEVCMYEGLGMGAGMELFFSCHFPTTNMHISRTAFCLILLLTCLSNYMYME